MRSFIIIILGFLMAGCSETALVVVDAISYGLNSHKTQDEIVDEILYDIRTGSRNFAAQYYGKSQNEVERMLGANGCKVNRYGYMKYVFKTNTSAGNLRTTHLEFKFRGARCISVQYWSDVERVRPQYSNRPTYTPSYTPTYAPVYTPGYAPAPVMQAPAPIIVNNNLQATSAPPVVMGHNNNNLIR